MEADIIYKGDLTYMAGVINKFLDFIKLGADDEDMYDDDIYDEEEEELEVEPEPVVRRKTGRRTVTKESSANVDRSRRTNQPDTSESSAAYSRREHNSRTNERNTAGKVVPMKTLRGMEVIIQKPTSFEDSEEICDMLLKGKAVVVNLEGFDSNDAQRIIDLLYGCIYAIGGKLNQISKYIFIFSPENIDVMGDITFDVDGVPTFNNEF